MAKNAANQYTVTGTITDPQNKPLPNLTVRALDRDPVLSDAPLGTETKTDEQGKYTILCTHQATNEGGTEKGGADVYIQVSYQGKLLGQSAVRKDVKQKATINLKVEAPDSAATNQTATLPTFAVSEAQRRVYGLVRDELGQVLDGMWVAVYDRDLRKEQFLGETTTKGGKYEVVYTAEQFARAEKAQADIVVKILGKEKQVLQQSDIFFNAPQELEVNLNLQGIDYQGPSEWETLTETIIPLLDGVPALELQENEQYQDVSFLAGETDQSPTTLIVWIAAHHLARKTEQEKFPIKAEACYGFLRQGQPGITMDTFMQDIQTPDRAEILKDKLLRDLAKIPAGQQQRILEKAIADNLIPLRVGTTVEMILQNLSQLHLQYLAEDTYGSGKGTISQLLDLTPEAKAQQTAFLTAYDQHTGNLDEFWEKVRTEKIFDPALVDQVQRNFELSFLTKNYLPLVKTLSRQFDENVYQRLAELARYDREDWVTILQSPGVDGEPIGAPENLGNPVKGKEAIDPLQEYGAALEEQFGRTFPTDAFAGKLHKQEETPLNYKVEMGRFFYNNPDFTLEDHRLEHYLRDNPEAMAGIANRQEVTQEIKTIQRIFKLNRKFQVVNAVLNQGLSSAQAIYFKGEEQLVADLQQAGISELDGQRTFQQASNTYAMALNLVSVYNQALNGVTPYGAGGLTHTNLPTDLQLKIDELPSLRSLFGSLDYCECTHCRSVYSPAAYFVDLLHFLAARPTQIPPKKVKDLLLERRPDLGEIELSCKNTNTPLPYIDLVNEILEDVVAPPTPVNLSVVIEVDLVAGPIKPSVLNELATRQVAVEANATVHAPDERGYWAIQDDLRSYKVFRNGALLQLLPTKQTHWTAAELRANPEHTNPQAYNTLSLQVYPFDLPFNLWYTQTQAYLHHQGVPLPMLQTLFQQYQSSSQTLTPSPAQIERSWLGLNETERLVITQSPMGLQSWDFWGLQNVNNHLLHPETPADPDANVTGTWIEVLSHVPIMLHRAGVTYRELLQLLDMSFVDASGQIDITDLNTTNPANCATNTLHINGLTATALNNLHRFVRLWCKLGCQMWELDRLIQAISPQQITDVTLEWIAQMDRIRVPFKLDWSVTQALYFEIDHTLYVDRSLSDAPAVQTLYQRLFRNKLVDAVAPFPEDPDDLSGLINDSIPGILAAFEIDESDLGLILNDLSLSTASPLNQGNLSNIYRHSILAKSLKISIRAFLSLKSLAGINPFNAPSDTLELIKIHEQIKASGLSIAQLDYLLAHQVSPNSGIAQEDKTIAQALEALRVALQKIADGLELKPEETAKDYIESKLSALPTLVSDEERSTALTIIEGSWTGTAIDRNQFINQYFADIFTDLVDAKNKLDDLPPGGTGLNLSDRYDYVQTALEQYLLVTQKEDLIKQKVADLFSLTAPVSAALLMQLEVANLPLLSQLNTPALLAKLANGAYQNEINETNFADAYTALRLLHKNALLINQMKLTDEELVWWLTGTRATDLDWVHPNDFPTQTSGSVPLAKLLNLTNLLVWRNALPVADVTAFEFLEQVLDPGTNGMSNIATLARLAGWEFDDILEMVGQFDWNVKQAFKQATSLQRLSDCTRAFNRLGVNAARAIGWAKSMPTQDDAESLKQTVKAKYNLQQWQEVIRPLQDQFREQKRDALVSFLVSRGNPNWMTANNLYSYFLIDIEMSACMLTSRIKQASASVQLFVQRCLMNLEKDIEASSTQWKQWQWMRYYRVWEANRKVFLYPENWLEPELRGEKSPFFKDLEKELMQNDVTHETAEEAYLNYLEKLDRVANLEIRTIHKEYPGAGQSTLHVFGRDRSSLSPEYYYRKQINKGRWTAWEKVEADIQGNHLAVGIHNRRLYLFWPQFLEKAVEPNLTIPANNSGTPIAKADRYWEVSLFWSELKQGKWAPKVLSDNHRIIEFQDLGGEYLHHLTLRTEYRFNPFIGISLFSSRSPMTRSIADVTDRSLEQVHFQKIGRGIANNNNTSPNRYTQNLIAAPESYYEQGFLKHYTERTYFYYDAKPSTYPAGAHPAHGAPHYLLLQKAIPNKSFTVLDSSTQPFVTRGEFFFWDQNRTYFVDYDVSTYQEYTSSGIITRQNRSFEFFIHYHPFVELFIKELNIWGVKGLLNRDIQVRPHTIPGSPVLFDFQDYQPTYMVKPTYLMPAGNYVHPIEDVDFTYKGAYSLYNWELFFHAPFHIANKLAANQRFEEALEWYHYIFDPTNADAGANLDTPQQKYWITKPFYETTKADYYQQKIENLLLSIANSEAEALEQVQEWRDNPFNPHLIARMRTVAYQKNVLMKYIQTLIAWGDQLFRRNTIETINEATQLYILADTILGPRPKQIPQKVAPPAKTFYQLTQEGLDDFGNALIEVENLLPTGSNTGGSNSGNTPNLPRLDVFYFCIPHNEKLLKLWDTVADRLFKIRNCMNIEGAVQQLPLFEPPIDPGALIKATAAGLDLGAALNDLNASLPLYRFSFMIQKALELCSEVKSLGAALLSALEKKDAEALALLRSSNELVMLDKVRSVRAQQIEEATKSQEAIAESRKAVEERVTYYEKLISDGLNGWEVGSLALTGGAIISEIVATVLNTIGTGTSLIPEFKVGAAGFGGTPTVTVETGGKAATSALSKAANVVSGVAQILQMSSGMTATIGSYNRRAKEWEFQQNMAEKELPQIDKQVAAAEIRKAIAENELKNHDQQRENLEKELEYMQRKFTNEELYDWMINQLSTLFLQTYQLAYDTAKRAERSFRYELGLSDSNYIQFGYWNSLKKGLLSGEKLHYDLKRMEMAYYEQNRREYELTKHISLKQVDPMALVRLRQTGECYFNIPETLFDMDYPGHYFRRIKSVGVSIPCIAGPYSTVACTLTLTSNSVRIDATTGTSYPRNGQNDTRFRDEIAAIQSIATSSGQNDSGVFELNFRDERYVPFEGAGAISNWHLKMNKDFAQFDFNSITDVVIHMNYMAREGGQALRDEVNLDTAINDQALAENQTGLFRVYDLKREFSTQWYQFLNPATPGDDQILVLDKLDEKLPYFATEYANKDAKNVRLAFLVDGASDYVIEITQSGSTITSSPTLTATSVNNAPEWREVPDTVTTALGDWQVKIKENGIGNWKSLPVNAIKEAFLIVNYEIS